MFYDSDDERDSFDVERRQIEVFQRHFLSASIESSEDDEEGIIDGTKIPLLNATQKTRARHSFLDISTLSSTSSISDQEPNPVRYYFQIDRDRKFQTLDEEEEKSRGTEITSSSRYQ